MEGVGNVLAAFFKIDSGDSGLNSIPLAGGGVKKPTGDIIGEENKSFFRPEILK
ncbi:hypothetical protein Fmac_010966 [Flemingia macrophylla]|uniref:Uncharacterized protein n=1 Tax=Flemingia macrophylla TaxID=520843 RepID=A0ABD1ML37_9FABA